jgi:uncharacterized iron-regulated protein
MISVFILLIAGSASLFAQEEEFNSDRLPIGDPERKFDFCAVKLNRIVDTQRNSEIAEDQLISELATLRIVMLGETHTIDQHHQMQLKVIRGLVEQGAKVCLALEMFNPNQDKLLNDYITQKIDEQTFLDDSGYYDTWGHNYRYYKPIFDYARDNQLPMYGVNIDREYASKIGRGGVASLSEEERMAIPAIDTSNVEHRFYIKVAMEGMDATSPDLFKKIYAAQSLWDAAMGDGAIRVAETHPNAVVVLLAGSGHVAYNLGIGKIIETRSELPFASLVVVDVPDTVEESLMMKVKKSIKDEEKDKPDEGKRKMPSMKMAHGAMDTTPHKIVIRSLADYLWGLPAEEREKYPSFGFSLEEEPEDGGFVIKRVIPGTLAEENGLKKGDVILTIDGATFKNVTKLKQHLHFKNWDDDIIFNILREEENLNITFTISNNSKNN